jgi:AcrR family transcriptional regulator
VPRPRVYDPDTVLDAAESLAVQAGPAAVTIRSVAAAAGVSNGAIYHTFKSRGGLVGHTWLRAARRFLAVQTGLVDAAMGTPSDGNTVAGVVAAAEALAVFAEDHRQSAQLLMEVNRDQLIGGDTPDDIAGELIGLDDVLIDLMIRLSMSLWDRKDAVAVEVIRTCIVDLPSALLMSRNRLDSPTAREQLRVVVRAVLALGPPARPSR